MRILNGVLVCLVVVGSSWCAFGEAPTTLDEWVSQVQAERGQAEALAEQGQLRAAADLLAASWRNLPAAYPQLADTATASMQLLLFIMEYLMDEPTVSQFVAESLSSQTGDSDKFIRTVYDIAIGQESAGKTQATVQMTYLTESSNPFVRVGALFMLSNPYYFNDPDFVRGMNSVLARDFPDLAITQEALRLSLYRVREGDAAALETGLALGDAEAAKSSGTPLPREVAAVQRVLANDEVATCVKEALPDLASSSNRAIEKFCNQSTTASDWRTRYGCLLLADRACGGSNAVFKSTYAAIAKRTDKTPDVERACVLVGTEFRNTYQPEHGPKPLDEAVCNSKQLLETDWVAFPFERNLYEECLKEVQNMAAWMGDHGHRAQAEALYQALAGKYPGSIVATSAAQRLQDLKK